MLFFRLSAAVSILASSCILIETFADWRARRDTEFTRILFWLQIGIFLNSLGYFLGPWAIPSEASGEILGASGTIFTCEIQGSLILWGAGVATCWDFVLSVVYLVLIRYNWSESSIRKLERYAHAFIWPYVTIITLVAIFLKLFNEDEYGCSIQICTLEKCLDGELTRGQPMAVQIATGVGVGLLFATILVSSACMVLIYLHARTLEARNRLYEFSATRPSTVTTTSTSQSISTPRADRRRTYSSQVMWQGVLYSGTILAANIPYIIVTVLKTDRHGLWFGVAASSRALYGLFYLIVFFRQRKHPKTILCRCLRRLMCALELCRPFRPSMQEESPTPSELDEARAPNDGSVLKLTEDETEEKAKTRSAFTPLKNALWTQKSGRVLSGGPFSRNRLVLLRLDVNYKR